MLIVFGNVHFPFPSSKQKRFIVNNAGVINLIFRSAKLKAHLTHVIYSGWARKGVPICHFFKCFSSSIFVLCRFCSVFFFFFIISICAHSTYNIPTNVSNCGKSIVKYYFEKLRVVRPWGGWMERANK